MSLDRHFRCDEQEYVSNVVDFRVFLAEALSAEANLLQAVGPHRPTDSLPECLAAISPLGVSEASELFDDIDMTSYRGDLDYDFSGFSEMDHDMCSSGLRTLKLLDDLNRRRQDPQYKSIALRALKYDMVDVNHLCIEGDAVLELGTKLELDLSEEDIKMEEQFDFENNNHGDDTSEDVQSIVDTIEAYTLIDVDKLDRSTDEVKEETNEKKKEGEKGQDEEEEVKEEVASQEQNREMEENGEVKKKGDEDMGEESQETTVVQEKGGVASQEKNGEIEENGEVEKKKDRETVVGKEEVVSQELKEDMEEDGEVDKRKDDQIVGKEEVLSQEQNEVEEIVVLEKDGVMNGDGEREKRKDDGVEQEKEEVLSQEQNEEIVYLDSDGEVEKRRDDEVEKEKEEVLSQEQNGEIVYLDENGEMEVDREGPDAVQKEKKDERISKEEQDEEMMEDGEKEKKDESVSKEEQHEDIEENREKEKREEVPNWNDPASRLVVSLNVFVGYSRPLEYHEIRLGRLLMPTHKIRMIGSQTLADLHRSFTCPQDYTFDDDLSGRKPTKEDLAKHKYPSSFFFIHDTFYVDGEHWATSYDMAENIRAYFSRNMDSLSGPMKIQDMHGVRLMDLSCRLGQPYVFVHQGRCEHLVVFNELHLASPREKASVSDYPLTLYEKTFKHVLCAGCKQSKAEHCVDVVSMEDNFFLPESPCYLCDVCYKEFCYKKISKKNPRLIKQFQFRSVPFIDRKAVERAGQFLSHLDHSEEVKKEDGNGGAAAAAATTADSTV